MKQNLFENIYNLIKYKKNIRIVYDNYDKVDWIKFIDRNGNDKATLFSYSNPLKISLKLCGLNYSIGNNYVKFSLLQRIKIYSLLRKLNKDHIDTLNRNKLTAIEGLEKAIEELL